MMSKPILINYDFPGVRDAVKKLKLDFKGTQLDLLDLDPESGVGDIIGTNYYLVNVMAQNLTEITGERFFPLSPVQSERALADHDFDEDPNKFSNSLGFVLFPNEGKYSNSELWKHLREQISTNFQNVDLDKPIVIAGLSEVVKDDKYVGGLGIVLGDSSIVYNVPILNSKQGKFDSEDPELLRTGFPSKLGLGSRVLRIGNSNSGVCRLDRNMDLSLVAGCPYLATYDMFGRVHLTKDYEGDK